MSKINKDMVAVAASTLETLPEVSEVVNGLVKPQDLNLFPTFKLVYPVEVTGAKECPFKNDHIRKMVVSDGKTVTTLEAPYTILTVACRNAARQEVKEGKETTYERAFDKVTFANKEFNNSQELYTAMAEKAAKKEEAYQVGLSAILAIVTKSGIVITEAPLFKTIHGYWYKPIVQALLNKSLKKQIGCRVDITDHSDNFITSQNGYAYPSKSKFKQYDMIEIPEETFGNVVLALKENEDKFMAWLER